MHYEWLVSPMNPSGLCLQPFLNIYIIFLHRIAVHLFICSHPFAWTTQPSSQPPLKKVSTEPRINVPAGFVLSVPSHITITTTMEAKVDLAAPPFVPCNYHQISFIRPGYEYRVVSPDIPRVGDEQYSRGPPEPQPRGGCASRTNVNGGFLPF